MSDSRTVNPNMSSSKVAMTPEKFKNLVMDLGKPTKRGVRNCPKCGILNGTRGLTCKNKSCEYVFKEGAKKKGPGIDAVKIVTGSTVQVFSVRLRDRGPDYRGFVQLPLVQDLDGNPAENVDPEVLATVLASTAKCYVDNCSRANPALGGQVVPACIHIRAAIQCTEKARALRLKNSVLNAIQVSPDTRQSIWELATQTPGPLAQRVTPNIIAVKCKPTNKHPLGFLHFTFTNPAKVKPGTDVESKFQCSCKEFKSTAQSSKVIDTTNRTNMVIQDGRISFHESLDENLSPKDNASVLSKDGIARKSKRCIHFYACVCSFASDDALAKEFAPYIQLVKFDDDSGKSCELASGGVEFQLEADEENLEQCGEQHSGVQMHDIADLQSQEETGTEEKLVVESLDVQHDFQVINQPDQVTSQSEPEVISVGGVITRISGVEENLVTSDIDISSENCNQADVLTSLTPVITQADVITQSDIITQPDAFAPDNVIVSSSVIAHDDDVITTETADVSFEDENGQNVEVIIDENQQIIAVSGTSPEPGVKRLKIADGSMVVVSEPSDRLAQASSGLLRLQESTAGTEAVIGEPAVVSVAQSGDVAAVGKRVTATRPAILRQIPKKVAGPADESSVQFTFLQWLSSVTERINQSMHYQFSGMPDPLVFHAPQVFFDCLQARISAGSKKKRLPNHTTGFVRKDALPLGMFTRYTWYITNILHVKQIFDTPEVSVDITRNFVENRDGTFDFVEKSSREKEYAANDGKNLPIRPFELKTYLKVGHTSPNQSEATPFIIEWIPDILPQSHIGELRIKFEYGHQRNGQLEDRSAALHS